MSKFWDDYIEWSKTTTMQTCGSADCGHDDCAFGYFKRTNYHKYKDEPSDVSKMHEAQARLEMRDIDYKPLPWG